MNIRWHRKAEIDLNSLSDYIAQDNPPAALRVFRKVVATAEQLASFPTLGRDGRVAGTRELIVSGLPYILVYRFIEDDVVIVAVQHASRLWPEGFPTD